jgi:hypothetical protein
MTTNFGTFTNSALLADFAAQVTLDHDARLLDMSPTANAMYDEILRRMNIGHPATITRVHVPNAAQGSA